MKSIAPVLGLAAVQAKLGPFVVPESKLEQLMSDPPSFSSSSLSQSPKLPVVDVVSIGSISRLDFLMAQVESWASHRSMRHYWGFSELNDFDPECTSSAPAQEVAAYVESCRAFHSADGNGFFASYYGKTEGGRDRAHSPGWLCAQRRPGRAFGWLHSQYTGGTEPPDYLLVVDDDSYVDVPHLLHLLNWHREQRQQRATVLAGCLFQAGEDSPLPFDISYGGFGTILDKKTITQLSTPIYCRNYVSDQFVCDKINKNAVGEAPIFKDGMTLFHLFYLYSSIQNFCYHSDWMLAYVLEHYVHSDIDSGHYAESVSDAKLSPTLIPIQAYPSCGNITDAGNTRPCSMDSITCHNLDPQDMEFRALKSYVDSPNDYSEKPMLSTTESDRAFDIIRHFESERADYNQKQVASKTFAYVTVLGWNPDNKQNNIYLDAVRVLLQSLKSSTVADFVVLLTHDNEEAQSLLQSEGAIVKRVGPMEYGVHESEFEPWFVSTALAKIRAFQLTEYRRVQVLDVDSFVSDVNEMDKLFFSYPESKLVAEGLGVDSPLRAGWILITPSQHDFDEMDAILKRGNFDSELGWDGLELDTAYPGWDWNDEEADKWDFYGSSLEQGLLYHYFYALPMSTSPSTQVSTLLILLDDEALHSHGFIHFYGNRKPWVQGSNSDWTFISAQIRWLEEYKGLRGDIPIASDISSHRLPLTKRGFEQYKRVLNHNHNPYGYAPTTSPTKA